MVRVGETLQFAAIENGSDSLFEAALHFLLI